MSVSRSKPPFPDSGDRPGVVSPETFTVIGGGPLFRFIRRMGLVSEEMEFLPRRILIAFVMTWIPVAILSIFGGRAWGGSVRIPFFFDIDLHARLLLALPLLLVAEVVVFRRMGRVVPEFLRRELVLAADRPKLDAAVASARRARDSAVAEVLLILFVYFFGVVFLWRQHLAQPGSTWYAIPAEHGRRLTAAGWWYALVSLPLWQFLLVRWYYRLVIWTRLLWRISRLDLQLVPTHPDRTGGLGFLVTAFRGFSTLLVAHGALVAGFIASRVFFDGARLVDFKMELGVYAFLMLLLILGPALVFAPALARLRRVGVREYGAFAQHYVRDFDRKWLRDSPPPDPHVLGSPDIQSLADLANSFELVRRTQAVPFTRSLVIQLAVAALVPVAPLLLTMFPLEIILKSVLKMIF